MCIVWTRYTLTTCTLDRLIEDLPLLQCWGMWYELACRGVQGTRYTDTLHTDTSCVYIDVYAGITDTLH